MRAHFEGWDNQDAETLHQTFSDFATNKKPGRSLPHSRPAGPIFAPLAVGIQYVLDFIPSPSVGSPACATLAFLEWLSREECSYPFLLLLHIPFHIRVYVAEKRNPVREAEGMAGVLSYSSTSTSFWKQLAIVVDDDSLFYTELAQNRHNARHVQRNNVLICIVLPSLCL